MGMYEGYAVPEDRRVEDENARAKTSQPSPIMPLLEEIDIKVFNLL